MNVLLPVDGSDNSNKAVADFIQFLNNYKAIPEMHLLNVQAPLNGNITFLVDPAEVKHYHEEEGLKRLQPARDLMDQAGLAYQFDVTVGEVAEMIVHFATEQGCDQIVMGSRGLGAVKGLLLGSIAHKVVQLSAIPVLLIK